MTQTTADAPAGQTDDGYDAEYAEALADGTLDPFADDPRFATDFYEDV